MIESIHLQFLLATFTGWVGRRQSRAIAYLIEENRVLKGNSVGAISSSPTISAGGWQPRASLGRRVLHQIVTITPTALVRAGRAFDRCRNSLRNADLRIL